MYDINSLLCQDWVLISHIDDYNSWQESWWGRRVRRKLDKNIILAEGISLRIGSSLSFIRFLNFN